MMAVGSAAFQPGRSLIDRRRLRGAGLTLRSGEHHAARHERRDGDDAGSVLGDESYFDSRRTAPGWKPSFYITQSEPLSALTVDRTWFHTHHSSAPAAAAAALFKDALRKQGVSPCWWVGVKKPAIKLCRYSLRWGRRWCSSKRQPRRKRSSCA